MTKNTAGVLAAKLGAMYPIKVRREEFVKTLNLYGTAPYEREIARVQLDILELAGTSTESIRMWVSVAKRDYRDVLAAAEYPNQLRAWTWMMTKDENAKLEGTDSKQYEEWINRNK